MANDFSSKFLNFQPYTPSPLDIRSPMDTEEAMKARKKAEEEKKAREADEEDPEDSMPAIEDEAPPQQSRALASQKDIDTMKQYPKSEAEENFDKIQNDRIAKEFQISDDLQRPEKGPSKYEDLLNVYRNLKPAQEQYQQNLGGLAMLQGANQIAQGVARGYGADIGAGEAGIKALKEQAAQPIQALGQQLEVGKSELALTPEIEMVNPQSDISKFAREQAAKAMSMRDGKVDPELLSKYQTQFSNMSAAQLEKLGFKNVSSAGMTPYQQMMAEIARDKVINQQTALAQGAERMGLSKEKIKQTLDTALSKEGQSLGKSIDAMDKTTRNGLGRSAASLMASTELETLIKSKPIDKLDKRDMEEVARIVNNMLTQGSTSAVSSIQALVPHTFKGTMAGFLENITNTPQSVEAQDFVKNYIKLAQKQKTKSMTDIDAIIKSRLPEFYRFKNEKPDEFNAIVNAKINALNTMSQSPEQSQQRIPEIAPFTGSLGSGVKMKESTLSSNEVRRQTSDGKIAIFDKNTKKFLRYEGQ